MSTRNSVPINTAPAGVDLSAKEYAMGKLVAGLPVACSVLGERSDFIIASPSKAGDPVDAFVERIVLIKVGAVAVALGAELTPDANGLAITAVSTNIVRAKGLEAGAAGQVIRALWVDAYAKP